MKQRISSTVILVVVLLLSGIATAHADEPVPTGQIRVIHASPGTPNLDIYLNSSTTPAISNLAYGTGTGYMTLPADTYTITIRASGSPANSAPIFERGFVVSADSAINIVAIGLLTRHNSRGFLLMFVPANLNASGLHYARVQVIHASPSYGTVNVYFNGVAALNDFLYGDGLFTGIDFVPGTYTYTLKPSKNDTTITELTLPNLVLQANTVYTIVDFGLAGNIGSLILADPLKLPVPQVQ